MCFFKKKNKIDINNLPVCEIFDLKPYSQLRFDLIYAKNQPLVDNDEVFICVRRYKNTLLKFMVVHKAEALEKYSLDNETLKEYCKLHSNLIDLKLEDLDLTKEVRNYILNEKSRRLIQYAFVNAKAERKLYVQYYFFNHETVKIETYRKLKDIDTLKEEALTSLYFDMACVDKEA